MTKPFELTAFQARKLIGQKKLSSLELVKSCLNRIKKINHKINAIVALDESIAIKHANEADKKTLKGEKLNLLHGIPVGIKDLNMVKDLRSTSGSLLDKDNIPKHDDEIVKKIRNEGGIIFCKTNTPEYGTGGNTTNKVYGTTKNPFDLKKSAAGSSGGSAAALSCDMITMANGSDYGGSLRTPASFCAVSGFRPSPGIVPAVNSSVSLNPFSVQGPMGKNVKDTFLLLQAQTDINNNDPFSSLNSISLPDNLLETDLSSIKMAYSSDLGCCPVDKGIEKVFFKKMKVIKNNFKIANNDHPDFLDIHNCFEVIRGFNYVSSHGEKYKNSKKLLGENLIDNVERGLLYNIKDLAWAHLEQTKIYKNFRKFFEDFDVLICPSASVSPYPHEKLFVDEINGKKMPTYMRWLALSYAPTMALPCAWSLPCGLDHLNMPFGIQLIAPAGHDSKLSEIALALENILNANEETKRPLPKI
mgnify:CR=1 FL=1